METTPEVPKKRGRGRPSNAELAARRAQAGQAPIPPAPPAPTPAPEPVPAPAPKKKAPKAKAPVPDPISEAASDLGRRGLGKKKTLTPAQREQRAEQAREMTQKRILVKGIVVQS